MDELIASVRALIKEETSTPADDTVIMGRQYLPLCIATANFCAINAAQTPLSYTVLFVDGGNSILFSGAGLCIGFIRTAAVLYTDNTRVKREVKEFFIVVAEKEGLFTVKTFPKTSFDGMLFNPEDESLRDGIARSLSTRIVPVVRRFAELEFAAAMNTAWNPAAIILDGTLESRYPYESEFLETLLQSKRACALAKTCSITTKNGFPVTTQLRKLGPVGAWYYYPLVENPNPLHAAEIYFIRLHERSSYVFRFETQIGFDGDVNALLSALAQNSTDPVFYGYPYGLIDVDAVARISDEEKQMLQTTFSVKLGKEWQEFSKRLSSMDAHEILDKIRF